MSWYGNQYGMQPIQQPLYQPVQQGGYPMQQGIKKVNGEQSALQYPVAPNTQSDPLFDMNGKVFYIVTADSAGYKTVETFDFFPHKNTEQLPQQVGVSREEFDALVAKVNSLEASNGIHGQLQPATTTASPAATTMASKPNQSVTAGQADHR